MSPAATAKEFVGADGLQRQLPRADGVAARQLLEHLLFVVVASSPRWSNVQGQATTILTQGETMMTNTMTNKPGPLSTEPACILRWVFHRGPDALTCAVEAAGGRSSYDVCILPHWDLSVATVEHFDAPASALRRHAEIASRLRLAGWMAQYGASHSTGIAA